MPKVSIITATYNAEKFIERAIKSVLWQTFQDWELIIVDDGSKDKTIEIVKDYIKKDDRIKLIELKKNTGGPAIPRTIGFKESKGKYIAFLDQDDIFYPENLEKRVKYLDDNLDIDILFTMAWAFDDETRKIINYEQGGPVNMIVRRKVIEEGDFFKKEQNGVDEIGVIYRYFLKDENNFKKTSLINEPISLYSRHPNQGSYIENKNIDSYIDRLNYLINELEENSKNNYYDKEFLTFLNKQKIWHYSRLGNFYCLYGNLKKGQDNFIKSLKIGFNFFSLIFFIFSFLGYKFYRKIEYFLRMFQRNILWKFKVFYYKFKFRNSYKQALNILKNI